MPSHQCSVSMYLLPATLVVDHTMRFSSTLRQMTRRLTGPDVEFDYWKWMDGGEFARYECKPGQATGKYRSLKVRRFAGCKSWPVPLVQGTWSPRLMTSGKDPQTALSKEVFENCEAMTRSVLHNYHRGGGQRCRLTEDDGRSPQESLLTNPSLLSLSAWWV